LRMLVISSGLICIISPIEKEGPGWPS